MGAKSEFPVVVRDQSVVVKIYRVKHRTAAAGVGYVVAWIGPDGRKTRAVVDFEEARELAENQAHLLANGIAEGSGITRGDLVELAEVRRLAKEGGATAFAALTEWVEARRLVGPALIEACRSWVKINEAGAIKTILLPAAVDQFIAEKENAHKQGESVYRAKLAAACEKFAGVPLHQITTEMWQRFLNQNQNAVTRNDIRKRIVTLSRWAQAKGFLSEQTRTPIEKTERAREKAEPIGIITPEQLRGLLKLFSEKHLEMHLAALVLANFCGVRAEEIHGKGYDITRRQRWEDIQLDRGFMSVTAAKENTPSHRIVNLTPAAVAWLRLCPDLAGRRYPHQKGYVCGAHAIDRIRFIAKRRGFVLPVNCFRHSFISYRVARTGDKAATATEAGNSVKEIDRRYRVPLPKFLGEEWETIMPPAGAASARRRRARSG